MSIISKFTYLLFSDIARDVGFESYRQNIKYNSNLEKYLSYK